LALLAVHVIQALGLIVVRLEGGVVDRPLRRDTVGVLYRREVVRAQPIEYAAPELGVPADAVVRVRLELLAAVVEPSLARAIPEVLPHRGRVPVLVLGED